MHKCLPSSGCTDTVLDNRRSQEGGLLPMGPRLSHTGREEMGVIRR